MMPICVLTIYDDTYIELFHSPLKNVLIYHQHFIDSKDSYKIISDSIDSRYNHRRIHGSIQYQSPDAIHNAEGIVA